MPRAKTIIAYEDVRKLADQALSAPRGIRLTLPKGKAVNFRQRFYTFRNLDRERVAEFEPSPDGYHISIYDALEIYLNAEEGDSEAVVEIRKRELEVQVEEF
jgi:hypothetical protein